MFRNIARSAREGSSGIVAALGPGLLPVLASATAGIVGVGAALGGAGAALGVFGAVSKTAFTEVQEASKKTDDLRERIALLTEQARVAEKTGLADAGKIEKARNKAITELMARYNLMPPALRQVTVAYDVMTASWKNFVDQNKPAAYAVMTSGFASMTAIIPKLQPLFDVGAAAAQRFVGWVSRITANGGVDRFVQFLTAQAGPAIDHLATIGRNLGITLGTAFRSAAPAGQGMLAWLAQLSEKAAAFAQGGGFERFMAGVNANGPGVASALSSIAATAGVLYQAVSPLAPVSLAVAGALATVISVIPPGVLTTLVAGWIAYSVAMKAYHAYVVAVGVATKISAAAQWLWNSATLAANFVRATAQIAAFLVKQVALSIATKASAAAQWLMNAAIVAGNFAAATAQLAGFLIKQGAIAVATKAWAAAQWLLNVAMSMNPIGLVIIAIVALIAIIVLLWTKCAWFRNFWIATWEVIKKAASVAWNWIKSTALAFWNWIKAVPGWIRDRWNAMWSAVKNAAGGAWSWIRGKVQTFYNWITSIPGKVSARLASMWNGLKSGFKTAINWVIGKWNAISFRVPSFTVFGKTFGGGTVGVPQVPHLATGGDVRESGLAVIHKGERVTPAAQVTPLRGPAAGRRQVVQIELVGERELVALFRRMMRTANLLQA